MARAPWDRMTGCLYGDLLRMGACFDPVTAMIVMSTAVSTVGAIQQASAASKADKFNAAVARQNAHAATDQANSQLAQQQTDTYRKLGAVKAAYGASGVGSGGSPMDVLADSFTQSELDANTIIYNGKLRAAGYTNTAALDEAAAKNARRAGYIDAASKALLGSSKAYDAYDSVGGNSLPWQSPGNVNPAGGYY